MRALLDVLTILALYNAALIVIALVGATAYWFLGLRRSKR